MLDRGDASIADIDVSMQLGAGKWGINLVI